MEWIPSPNHYDSIKTVWAICVHTMAGSLASCDSWFQNPSSQVSSHYGVGLNGELHQYVSLEQGSWANGILEPGNLWTPYFGSTENPNMHSISCETEDLGDPNQPVTDAEYAGTLAACHLAIERWGSISTLTTHRAISPNSRPSCAGSRWWGDSQRLQKLAKELGLALLL